MQKRDEMRAAKHVPGPVITISRQYGCNANKLAIKLIAAIAEKQKELYDKQQWIYINKEIIEESAKELKMTPTRIEQRIIEQSAVNDLFSSLTQHYTVTDKVIVQKIEDIVQTYAYAGHVIIIGRGGACLTQDINRSLHVKIVAPLKWRAKNISKKKDISLDESIELTKMVDVKRIKWSEKMSKRGYDDGLFDVILNREKLSDKEMLQIIIELLLGRKLLR